MLWLSFENRSLLWNYRKLFFKNSYAAFVTNSFLGSRILPYVYRFLQTKVMNDVLRFSNIPPQYFTRNFFLDSKIRGLWTFAEPCTTHPKYHFSMTMTIEVYLGPCQTTLIYRFCKSIWRKKALSLVFDRFSINVTPLMNVTIQKELPTDFLNDSWSNLFW